METEKLNSASIGAQLQVSIVGCITGNLTVRQPKSHSIIALNLQTIEDVEQVIRQCEALKGQMQGGSGEYRYPTHKDDMGFLCTDLTKSRINP